MRYSNGSYPWGRTGWPLAEFFGRERIRGADRSFKKWFNRNRNPSWLGLKRHPWSRRLKSFLRTIVRILLIRFRKDCDFVIMHSNHASCVLDALTLRSLFWGPQQASLGNKSAKDRARDLSRLSEMIANPASPIARESLKTRQT